MKKLFSIILIVCMLFVFIPEKLSANADEGYFVVTAYYSPLPNQKHYLKGNYTDEIRLNWRWIAWASGKKVFSGMLAAPKNYQFGTKIKLEGLWIGSVEDRGGAIVNAWNRGYSSDRIDVWMWYWDEGLRRALYWGKRKIKWSIISPHSKTTIDYKNIPSPLWATTGLITTPSIFYKSIWKKSSKQDITSLKSFLSWIWVYQWEVNDVYSNDLISYIYDFQIKSKILQIGDIQGAGYWGKKTRAQFLEQYRTWELEYIDSDKSINNDSFEWYKNDIFYKKVATNSDVSELQNILLQLELYNWEINWDYNSIQDIILNYQLDNNIIASINTLGSWYYWPKTRKSLYLDYTEYEKYKEKIEGIKIELTKLKDQSLQKAEKKILDLWGMAFWNISPKVRELQILLKDLGYFDNKDTAIYWNITKNAILAFQIDHNIVTNKSDLGAGNFWPVTKTNLIQKLSEVYYVEEFAKKEYDEDILVVLKKWSMN